MSSSTCYAPDESLEETSEQRDTSRVRGSSDMEVFTSEYRSLAHQQPENLQPPPAVAETRGVVYAEGASTWFPV